MNPANVSQLRRKRDSSPSPLLNASELTSSQASFDCHCVIPVYKSLEPVASLLIENTQSTPTNIEDHTRSFHLPAVSEIRQSGSHLNVADDRMKIATNTRENMSQSRLSLQPDILCSESQVPPVRCVSFASDIPAVSSGDLLRPRSGSWSGVNESDDELDRLNQNILQASNRPLGSLTSSMYGSINNQYVHPSYSTQTPPCQQPNSNRYTAEQTRRMRLRLKYFFMNPIEKWAAKRRFPWKLLVQVVKIVIVTLQLWLFAEQRYSHVAYLWDTRISFSHLFLLGWDSSREVNAYPPSDGPLAVYSRDEFFSYLDYAVTSYTNLTSNAIGSYEYHQRNNETVLPSQFCCDHYVEELGYLRFNCIEFPWALVHEAGKVNWNTKQFLKNENFELDFDTLMNCYYNFSVKAVKLRSPPEPSIPDCYNLTSVIVFNNDDRDGQMLVGLNIQATVLTCGKDSEDDDDYCDDDVWSSSQSLAINIVTIVTCSVSLVMCLRSLYHGQILRYEATKFFKDYQHRTLDVWEKLEFCNLWYVLIFVNDVLIIIGTLLKLGLESRIIGDTTVQVLRVNHAEFVKGTQSNYQGYLDTWNVCSLFLGVGNLLVWFGCLRYLGFFKTYNVLILTMKKCLPDVLRFIFTITLMFAGYCFCGWLVLSPYHMKFRTLSMTMETLFSLINGDDMFATFSSTSAKDPLIWWFSRAYLYTFIMLFIYVVLSLFLAIIMDAYDTIKDYYANGFPLSPLMKFASECREPASSRVYYEDGDRTLHDFVNKLCCCCFCVSSDSSRSGGNIDDESSSLLQ